jgi:hypothetical protein
VTLVAAAVCPHPPLLVPEVGRGEVVAARAPAIAAVSRLVAADPDVVVVVGDAPRAGRYRPGQSGTFAGFGVNLRVTLGSGRDGGTTDPVDGVGEPARAADRVADLPLSLTVGAWLLGAAGWPGPRWGYGVSARTPPDRAARIGADLVGVTAAAGQRLGLLVMGDGSARRTPKAPGGFDDRAEAHDRAVRTALADADPAALLALDPLLADDLLAAGRASWQVLAGALLAAAPDDADRRTWSGDVLYDDAPYGVGYLVVVWERGSR